MSTRGVAAAAGLVYLVLYLGASQDLSFDTDAGWTLRVATDWSSLWMQARSPFRFEGIAMIEAGALTLLLSPLDLLIAGILGVLVALNVHGVLALRGTPSTCRPTGAGAGLLGAAPALLASGACCAPALILLIGMPGLGAVAGLFGWLIPLSLALLVASRWWLRRHGAPACSYRSYHRSVQGRGTAASEMRATGIRRM